LESKDNAYLLYDEATLRQIAHDAVQYACKMGFEEVAASVVETAGLSVRVREGVPEIASRDGSQRLIVNVFNSGRLGASSTSALTKAAIEDTVSHAIAIAKEVAADEGAGLADPSWLARNGTEVELYAPSGLSASDILSAAEALEAAVSDAATHLEPCVRVLGASASSQDRCVAQAIGRDFCRSRRASHQSRSCLVLAEREGLMTRDHWASVERKTADLLSAEEIGKQAASRAVRKLGACTLKSQTAPVLFDSTIAMTLVQPLCSALVGSAQHQQSTFLPQCLGKPVVASHLDLVEDPFEPFGLASAPFDDEGVAGSRRAIVSGGIAEGYFLSARWARKLSMRSTGNASGPWNLRLTSRRDSPGNLDGMLRELNRGLWVTELLGGQVDAVKGTYSMAASGFWVDNGVATFPVNDFTIAGSLPEILLGIEAIGTDVFRNGGIRSGSILVNSMQIAGR
jgi:PmbA protein